MARRAASGRKKHSAYGQQLRAKQQLKGYYNMSEKQFRKTYGEAIRRKGDSSENLVGLLERRLDMIVLPRQFCADDFLGTAAAFSHKHIMVNGHKVNIPSYQVRDGDVVEIKEKSQQMPLVMETSQKTERDVPQYINLNAFKATFVRQPQYTDIPYPVKMEPNLVIEFYSR